MSASGHKRGNAARAAAAAFVVLLGAAGARAEDKLPPADEPTAWSCTAETLLAETKCVFEAKEIPATDPAGQAAENVKRAASLAARGCRPLSKLRGHDTPDKELQARCEKDFADAAARACTLEGRQPLLDVGGRFPDEARTCYEALQEVLRRTRQAAALAVSCCRCLAAKGCAVKAEQCQHEAASLNAGPQLQDCLASGCSDECGHVLPPAPRGAAPAQSSPTRTGTQWY